MKETTSCEVCLTFSMREHVKRCELVLRNLTKLSKEKWRTNDIALESSSTLHELVGDINTISHPLLTLCCALHRRNVTHTHTLSRTHKHAHVCAHVRRGVDVCLNSGCLSRPRQHYVTHIDTHTHTHIDTHTHRHTHTQIHAHTRHTHRRTYTHTSMHMYTHIPTGANF